MKPIELALEQAVVRHVRERGVELAQHDKPLDWLTRRLTVRDVKRYKPMGVGR